MTTLSYCQETYPKTIVLNKDTLVLISQMQVKTINKVFAYKDYLEQTNKMLDTTLNNYKLLTDKKDSLIFRLNKENNQKINDLKISNNKFFLKTKTIKRQRNVLFYISAVLTAILILR